MPDPNNIIFPDLKLAFMCIPKNANSSIKRALCEAFDIPTPKNEHDPKLFLYTNKQWILAQKDWLKIAVVRNPLDRVVSCYRQKVVHPERLHSGFLKYKWIKWKMPFVEFIKRLCDTQDWLSDQHWRSQTYDLFYKEKPVYNYQVRFENLKEEWPVLVKDVENHCGLKLPNKLGTKNKTSDKIPYPKFNKQIENKIYKRYLNDFLMLGYRK